MSTYNVPSSNLLFRGIDGILTLNISRFIDHFDCIYLLVCSNIPVTPAYGIYVSQLKWCSASWGSPSWTLICFIDTVSRMNTDMLGLYWLQVISFVLAHDLLPCVTYDRLLASAASWMPLVEQDLIYHRELLYPTPVLMGFLLLEL